MYSTISGGIKLCMRDMNPNQKRRKKKISLNLKEKYLKKTFDATNDPSTQKMENIMHDNKVKSSSLAKNRRETRDKRPLDREPDRSWCHLHTSVKLVWSQPVDPWTVQ